MKYCANCGAKLKDGAKFCTSCGQAIVQKTEPQPKAVEQAEATAQPQPAPAGQTVPGTGEKAIPVYDVCLGSQL